MCNAVKRQPEGRRSELGKHPLRHTQSILSPASSFLCLSTTLHVDGSAISQEESDRGSGKEYRNIVSKERTGKLEMNRLYYTNRFSKYSGDPQKAKDNHSEQTPLTLCWWFKNKLASLQGSCPNSWSSVSLPQPASCQLYLVWRLYLQAVPWMTS